MEVGVCEVVEVQSLPTTVPLCGTALVRSYWSTIGVTRVHFRRFSGLLGSLGRPWIIDHFCPTASIMVLMGIGEGELVVVGTIRGTGARFLRAIEVVEDSREEVMVMMILETKIALLKKHRWRNRRGSLLIIQGMAPLRWKTL